MFEYNSPQPVAQLISLLYYILDLLFKLGNESSNKNIEDVLKVLDSETHNALSIIIENDTLKFPLVSRVKTIPSDCILLMNGDYIKVAILEDENRCFLCFPTQVEVQKKLKMILRNS